MTDAVFTHVDERLGELSVRPVDAAADAELLHRWLTHPKSVFWLMQHYDLADVEREFGAIANSPHHEAFLGLHDGSPAFVVERYDPAHVELAGMYAHRDGDIGMHFLCAPTDTPVHGFTLAVITTAMELCFADQVVDRVVVDPDVRNTAVHVLNEAVGFEVVGTLAKPEKEALLSTCTRAQFQAAQFQAARDLAERGGTA